MTTQTEGPPKIDPAAEFVDTPPAPPLAHKNRGTLAIAAAALVLTVTAPYWSAPLYRVLHLRPSGLEWQARQAVEIGRLGQSVAELDRRVSELTGALDKANEQVAAAKSAQSAAEYQVRVLALLQLRAALRRPVPFDTELKAVRALGGKLDELEPLFAVFEPYAANGILVESQLRREFSTVADLVARDEPRPSVMAWLSSVSGWVSAEPVPPAAEVKVDRPSSVAERAAAHLADDNLRGAVEEFATIDVNAAAPAREWLGEARARIAANQAIDRIAELVATALNRTSPRS